MDVSMASYPLLLLLFVSNIGSHVNHVPVGRQPPIQTDSGGVPANLAGTQIKLTPYNTDHKALLLKETSNNSLP